jgi:hypothetical protein
MMARTRPTIARKPPHSTTMTQPQNAIGVYTFQKLDQRTGDTDGKADKLCSLAADETDDKKRHDEARNRQQVHQQRFAAVCLEPHAAALLGTNRPRRWAAKRRDVVVGHRR